MGLRTSRLERSFRRRLGRAALIALLLAAAAAHAADAPDADALLDLEAPLLPIPQLLRPRPRPARAGGENAAAATSRCQPLELPASATRLPFGPGESLSYDVVFLGLRTGQVKLSMGEAEEMDGHFVYPVYADGRTDPMLSVLGGLNGRMVSFLDSGEMKPLRMANRFDIAPLIGARSISREDAAFSLDGRVHGQLLYRKDGRTRTYPAHATAEGDLVDVASLVYYARSRPLVADAPFCIDVYHRRRLWRVEGTMGGVELVNVPYGLKLGRRLDATIRKIGGKRDEKPREIQVWVTDDAQKLPLIVRSPEQLGTAIEVRLRDFHPGRHLSAKTAPR